MILIAGNSTRYGKNINKNLELINGKHILEYSLEIFDNNIYIDDIIIASRKKDKELVEKIIKKIDTDKNISIVKGGKERKESVYNCIKNTDSEIVVIHDGARPLIKNEYIIKLIKSMDRFKGSSIAVKSKDTIKIGDENGIAIETTKRTNTWIVQTPQCFDRRILLKENEKCKEDDYITDDCMLLEKSGHKVKLIEGNYRNIKLTDYEDFKILEYYMKGNIIL